MPSRESFSVTPGVFELLCSADSRAKADGRTVITQEDLRTTLSKASVPEEPQGTAVVLYELMQVKVAVKPSGVLPLENITPVEPLATPAPFSGAE